MKELLPLLLVLLCLIVSAQTNTRVVHGQLTDPETGLPLPGVNVVIKGTATGTVTDGNGYYTIEAPIGSTLVFSFVGHKTREMLVSVSGHEEISASSERTFLHVIPDDPEKTSSPYFFIKSDDPSVDQMPLKSTSAIVYIAGVIADVRVRQTYVNTGENPIEAVYIFPGSTRAAVYAMTMNVGKRKIIATIKEKKQARQDYEAARQQGRTASLLEQARPNVFQMNVANILPGDTIAVDFRYTELIVPAKGTYEFVYPTVVGPRYSEIPGDAGDTQENWVASPYQHEGEAPLYSFDFRTAINTGIPIQRITSPSHKIEVEYADRSRATIRIDDKESSAGNRDVILRYRLRGGEVESGLLVNPGSDENFFLLMMEPPDQTRPDQIPPREYIFIVDVSGSMHGFPIGVSKTVMTNLLSTLRPDDRFNVMVFESNNTMLFPSAVNATNENIEWAARKLEQQQGGGGTRLLHALNAALSVPKQKEFSRTFVVITDGYVTVEKEAFNLIRSNLGQANLFAIGIGSSVNRYLIEGLAHAGMGEPFIVTNEKEAKLIGQTFTDFVQSPVLTNIKVHYDNLEVYDIEPASVPDVFAERPIIIYGKYRGALRGSVRVTGYSGTSPWERSINVSEADQENNDGLRYLWARNKIRFIDDFGSFYNDADAEKTAREVTKLGLKYNLLTQYTSFVAIDSVTRNHSGKAEQTQQPSPLPQGVSDNAVGLSGYVAGISLSADVTALSEVVVVGYSSAARRTSTGTVSVVSQRNALQNELMPDVLVGRISGTSGGQNQGAPYNGASVRIRGNSTVALNGGPLIIVNGVPLHDVDLPGSTAGMSSPSMFEQINSNDIESIQVMKGPGSTAIYGSRGASGAIIITTKKRQTPGRSLELTSSVISNRVNKLPATQDRFAQGSPINGVNQWNGPETGEVFSWGPALSTLHFDHSDYSFDKNGRLSPSATGAEAMAYNPTVVFKDGLSYQNHLRYSGLSEKSKFDVSLAHRKINGVLPGTTSEILSGRTFFRYSSRRFHAGIDNHVSDQRMESVHSGNSPSAFMRAVLTAPPSFDNANGLGKSAFRNQQRYLLDDGSPRSYSPGVIDNPFWSLSRNKAHSQRRQMTPSMFAGYRVAEWLEAKTTLSAQVSQNDLLFGIDRFSAASPDGSFLRRNERFYAGEINVMLDATKYFLNSDLRLDAELGWIYATSVRKIGRTQAADLLKPGRFESENAALNRNYTLDFTQRNRKMHSHMNVSFKEVIAVDFAAVHEASSTLNESLYSASAGLSFDFGNLNVIRDLNAFNLARIHFSTGRIQREAPLFFDPNHFTASAYTNQADQFVPEWITYQKGNLRPESVSSFEGGMDVAILAGRVGLSASMYRNMTRDGYTPMAENGNYGLRNGAEIRNTGVELDVKLIPVQRAVRWTTNFAFSRSRSVVLSLPDGIERVALAGFNEIASSLVPGQPYGVLVGTRFLRNIDGKKVIGPDGFPLVNDTEGVLGNPNPDWMLGIDNVLSFRNFDLGILVDVRYGGQLWNGTRSTMNYYGTGIDTEEGRMISGHVFDGVTASGEANEVPVAFADAVNGLSGNRWVRYGRAGVAEERIEDASWLRLKNLSLTYNVPDKLVSRFKMTKASVTFVSTNVFLMTRYSGIDPDTNLTGDTNGRGLDYFNLPNTRSYGLMLKVGF